MANDGTKSPEWVIGTVSELDTYMRQHSGSSADVDQLIPLLDAGVRVWRKDPRRYVEHFGYFANFLCTQRGTSAGAELDHAVELCREATAIAGMSGLIANRLRLLGLLLDVALARRSGGAPAMAQRLSAHCASLCGELGQLVAPSLLADLVRNLVRLAHAAAEDQQW